MSLSSEQIASAKPGKRPVKLFDGRGLYLLLHPSGGRWWRFKYRLAGREGGLSLGIFPEVSLAEARTRRDRYRAMVAEGINPSDHIRAERAARLAEQTRLGPAPRFWLGSNAALSFQLKTGRLTLTPDETAELRDFLDSTRAVIPKVTHAPH
jgi:hypothetical protein